MSPNRKRRVARLVIWSVAATTLLAGAGHLLAARIA